jgi:hypothetical protein
MLRRVCLMSVLTYCTNLASRLVLSPEEEAGIKTSVSYLHKRLHDYFGSTIRSDFQFGSSVRRTILPRRVDERSDVDYMVVFVNAQNLSPQTLLNYSKEWLQQVQAIRNQEIRSVHRSQIRVEKLAIRNTQIVKHIGGVLIPIFIGTKLARMFQRKLFLMSHPLPIDSSIAFDD